MCLMCIFGRRAEPRGMHDLLHSRGSTGQNSSSHDAQGIRPVQILTSGRVDIVLDIMVCGMTIRVADASSRNY